MRDKFKSRPGTFRYRFFHLFDKTLVCTDCFVGRKESIWVSNDSGNSLILSIPDITLRASKNNIWKKRSWSNPRRWRVSLINHKTNETKDSMGSFWGAHRGLGLSGRRIVSAGVIESKREKFFVWRRNCRTDCSEFIRNWLFRFHESVSIVKAVFIVDIL